jgi:primosomal protein N' (replication factor Y)
MLYAAVALDIAARELDAPFTYRIPNELEGEVCVGVTVRVAFSGRPAIGYVLAVTESAPAGVPLEKILPVNQVLAGAAFDEGAAELAGWMAREYAAPLADCVRLFVAPGQKVRMTKGQDGSWSLTDKQVGEVDDRWVALTEEGRAFTPRKNAHRQRSLLEALGEGPQRMAELNAMLGAMGTTVRALEKRGLVARCPSTEDRRATDVRLTDAGFDHIVAAAPGHVRRPRQEPRGVEIACGFGLGHLG